MAKDRRFALARGLVGLAQTSSYIVLRWDWADSDLSNHRNKYKGCLVDLFSCLMLFHGPLWEEPGLHHMHRLHSRLCSLAKIQETSRKVDQDTPFVIVAMYISGQDLLTVNTVNSVSKKIVQHKNNKNIAAALDHSSIWLCVDNPLPHIVHASQRHHNVSHPLLVREISLNFFKFKAWRLPLMLNWHSHTSSAKEWLITKD